MLYNIWWALQSSLICTISCKLRLKQGFKKVIKKYGLPTQCSEEGKTISFFKPMDFKRDKYALKSLKDRSDISYSQ